MFKECSIDVLFYVYLLPLVRFCQFNYQLHFRLSFPLAEAIDQLKSLEKKKVEKQNEFPPSPPRIGLRGTSRLPVNFTGTHGSRTLAGT